jgi:SM-20-related protein
MDIKEKSIFGDTVYCIDNLMTEKEIADLYEIVIKLPFIKAERSHEKDEYLSFRADFLTDKFEKQLKVGAIARKLLTNLYPGKRLALWRAYINMSNFGDVEYPHTDCQAGENDITILYYAHKEWKKAWGGEIMFYHDNEVVHAITPKAGRFVVFPGIIEHVGTVPTRICKHSRYSFAMKYKVTTE